METGDPSVSLDLLVRSPWPWAHPPSSSPGSFPPADPLLPRNAIDDDGRARRARRAAERSFRRARLDRQPAQRMRCGGRRGPQPELLEGSRPLDHRIGHLIRRPTSSEARLAGRARGRVLTDLEVQILRSNPLQHAVLDSRRDRHDGLEPDALGRGRCCRANSAAIVKAARRVTAGAPSRPPLARRRARSHARRATIRQIRTRCEDSRRNYCDIAANPSRSLPRSARREHTAAMAGRGGYLRSVSRQRQDWRWHFIQSRCPWRTRGDVMRFLLCAPLMLVVAFTGCTRPSQIQPSDLRAFTTDGCSGGFPEGPPGHPNLWCDCWRRARPDLLEGRHMGAASSGGREAQGMRDGEAPGVDRHGDEAGVRVGGTPYLPTSYRWAYGWPFLRAATCL